MAARHMLAAAAIAVGLSSSSVFSAIPWSTPNGVSPSGAWAFSGGGSDNGLFGSPVVSAEGFTFFPSNFFAESSNGVAQTKRDRLYVKLDALPNGNVPRTFLGIEVSEVGDYSILGPGTVKVSGLITATVLMSLPGGQTVGTVYSQTLTSNPAMPISTTTSVDGAWTANFGVAIPEGAKVLSVQLVLNNVLQAISSPGGTAFIEKKVFGGTDPNGGPGVIIRIREIPEPVSLGALAGVSLLMLRRR